MTTEAGTPVTREQVIAFLEGMTLTEAMELVKELEEKFGVSAAAPVAVQAAGSGAAAAPEVAEKTEFDVILTSYGSSKINVIKEVRKVTGLGLKEAKDVVDGVPKELKQGISKKDAEEIKEALVEAGASVEIK